MRFADHFSTQADRYTQFRPHYPADLFAYLATACPAQDAAWDCGTGNGQAAVALAEHFRQVFATDASAEQIRHAAANRQVHYHVAQAEQSGLPTASADLVTVAQALHWFSLPAFYDEVRRVGRPQALLAVWTYNKAVISPEVDRVVEQLYSTILDGYWPDGRLHVENSYRDIPFPFDSVATPRFEIVIDWRRDDFFGYLSSWSAVARYRQDKHANPLELIESEFKAAWGPGIRPVRWPLKLLLGRVHGTTPVGT